MNTDSFITMTARLYPKDQTQLKTIILFSKPTELLKLFDDKECYGTNITQSDAGKKCQNVLQLNVNEISTDQPSVYIEGRIHNNLFYESEDPLVYESGKRKKIIKRKEKKMR